MMWLTFYMNRKSNIGLLKCARLVTVLALFPFVLPAMDLPVTPGKFSGTMDSLTSYECPQWFRDAKFGIWAHWGPQAVPMEGDWYARKMYQQGSADYNDHLARFGHPSTNGWKDIIPLWHAEKWEPEKLMALYKKAGAKYFVSMGTHHDDFFLWNSPLHKWNAVNYGPHRDVVAAWQKAAKENGLPFGVSEHLGASFTWFQDSHKADKTGPFAGVPYDGANSNYWDLYHFPAEPDDNKWYSNNPRWQQEWFNEIKELVDNYHPDLLYSDGGVAFGNEIGLSLIADFYNSNLQHNHGRLTAIYNCKEPGGGRWVQDYERGVNGGIDPYPWQCDTSIGDWFYNKHWKYQPLSWTVHMLVDITSKNGNLLLNVVLRPDGSLDPEVETMLHQLADWTAVNGEAIYGTRPWLVFGEGEVKAKGGMFKENFNYSARDIRFTTKGKTLYAIALGWPEENKIVIKSLAKMDGANQIKRVELLGYKGKLKFTQTDEGLTVELPGKKLSDLTCPLRITGSNLKPAPIPELPAIIMPDTRGRLTFSADDATLHGKTLRLEDKNGTSCIGFWEDAGESVSWNAQFAKPGRYKVSATTATLFEDANFVVEVGGVALAAVAPNTGAWENFEARDLGEVEIKSPGQTEVKVHARDAATWKPINLNSVQLTPTDDSAGAAAGLVQSVTKVAAEILTPPAPESPRINGPKVFGVRPGSPFLFNIPATGKRPMTFSVGELPAGLKLDPDTGRITGALTQAGEFTVKFRVKNDFGLAEQTFRIVAGEQIALTPPLGWNTYNCWGNKIDQDKVLRSARALVASGLDQHGWNYINLDDGWQGARGGSMNAIQSDANQFPDMKRLCDQIHGLGLKVGIYSTPWTVSYAGRLGGSSENPDGKWNTNADLKAPKNKNVLPFAIGKYSFTQADATQWAAWGIDYLKFDWGPVTAPPATAMHQALRATGRDIVLSLSNNHEQNLFNEIKEVSQTAEAWRTTGDIYDEWNRVKDIGFSQDKWTPFGGPGHWNDPDMLVVGQVGWGRPHPTKLTPDEQYTHISLWCLLSAPLLIGCDLEKLDAFTFGLLSNDEVLAVDQDSFGKQASCVITNGDSRIYVKDLEDGSKAVGLFNLGNQSASMTAVWSELGISGTQTVRDLWRQKNLGEFPTRFETTIAPHGVMLIRAIPAN